MFRRFIPWSFAVAVLAGMATGATAAPAPLPAFVAHYQLLRDGSAMGTATLTLTRGKDGTWTFTTTSKGTSGLAGLLGISSHETSVFEWVGNLPQCRSYDYAFETGLKDRRRTVRCDWADHTIVVDDNGVHRFPSQAGTLERHTVPLALAAGLAAGERDFDLPVAVRDRVEMQRYVAAPGQSVTVPAGTFDAVRVTRTDDDHRFEAWFAPGKLPAPVKIEQRGKSDFALQLLGWSAP